MTEQSHPLAARLAATVRGVRKAHGWTQDELAERLGVTRQMISFIEMRQLKSVNFELLAALDPLTERCWVCGKFHEPVQELARRAVARRKTRK